MLMARLPVNPTLRPSIFRAFSPPHWLKCAPTEQINVHASPSLKCPPAEYLHLVRGLLKECQ
jgi:hypothetical protein